MTFRITLGCALIPAAIATFFLLWQLAEGPYDGIGIFLLGVGLIWASIAAGIAIKRHGNPVLGTLILLLTIVPFALYAAIVLTFVFGGVSWR